MNGVLRLVHPSGAMAVVVLFAIGMGVASCAHTSQPSAIDVTIETIRVRLPEGSTTIDVYWPDTNEQAPIVIIAHGFMRHRNNMSGWGKHLAKEGFVAVVPDLPAWSDHARNGRFISDLQAYFTDGEVGKRRIDPTRIGLMGFSAGGLASLLSAADSRSVSIWVGLDPVDRGGMGAAAAPSVQAHTIVITADPSVCNAHGNALDIVAALPRPEHLSVSGAVHVDAEWPTSWIAELFCGRSTEKQRGEFRMLATEVLREALQVSPLFGIRFGRRLEY